MYEINTSETLKPEIITTDALKAKINNLEAFKPKIITLEALKPKIDFSNLKLGSQTHNYHLRSFQTLIKLR